MTTDHCSDLAHGGHHEPLPSGGSNEVSSETLRAKHQAWLPARDLWSVSATWEEVLNPGLGGAWGRVGRGHTCTVLWKWV